MLSHNMAREELRRSRSSISATWRIASVLALSSLITTTHGANNLSVPSSIIDLVPTCAQTCFQSFIQQNFPAGACGTTPSLQCLCAHTGSSGFTLGEGAVQCIVAEGNVGACTGADSSSSSVAAGYSMCNNQVNAAPETHPTIVATLAVPIPASTSTSSSTPTTTTASATSSTSETSASSTATSAAPSLPSSSIPNPTITDPSQTSAAASSTNTAVADASPKQMSTGAIVGVVLAIIAAVLAAAIAATCIIRRTHRNKMIFPDDEKTGFARMRDSWSPKRKQTPVSYMPEISAPQYQDPLELAASRFQTPPPKEIGLAISPDGNAAAPAQFANRVLPPLPTYQPYRPDDVGRHQPQTAQVELADPAAIQRSQVASPKPALTLTIPSKPPAAAQLGLIPLAAARRPVTTVSTSSLDAQRKSLKSPDTAFTEFAEDGEDPVTAVSQVWRPPPSDPTSATTYYVADQYGNWKLGSQPQSEATPPLPVELATGISKTRAEASYQNAGVAHVGMVPEASQRAATQVSDSNHSRPAFRIMAETFAGHSEEYDVTGLSSAHQVPPAAGKPVHSGAQSRVKDTLQESSGLPTIATSQNNLDNSRRRSTSKKTTNTQKPRNRSESVESSTTIASSADGTDFEDIDDVGFQPNMPQPGLSPVVEAPSPVTDLKVHGPSITYSNFATQLAREHVKPSAMTLAPAPAGRRVPSPANKSSPTLGAVAGSKPARVASPPATQQQQPQVSAAVSSQRSLQPYRPNYAQTRTGSPNIGAEPAALPAVPLTAASTSTDNRPSTPQSFRRGLPAHPRDDVLPPARVNASPSRTTEMRQIQLPSSARSWESSVQSVQSVQPVQHPALTHMRNASADMLSRGRQPEARPMRTPELRAPELAAQHLQQSAMPRHATPPRQQQRMRTPPVQQYGVEDLQPRPLQVTRPQQQVMMEDQRPQPRPQQVPIALGVSSTSGLLARRGVGLEKAAALAMGQNNHSSSSCSQDSSNGSQNFVNLARPGCAKGWRRDGNSDSRAQLPSQQAVYHEPTPQAYAEQKTKATVVEAPPMTPGFGTFTPTRRGDDLFLDVQKR